MRCVQLTPKNIAYYYDVPNLLHSRVDGPAAAVDNNNRLNMPDNRFYYLKISMIDIWDDDSVDATLLRCRHVIASSRRAIAFYCYGPS